MRFAVVIGALLLGGCAETLARVTTDAAYLHESASDYVREIHSQRQAIRLLCRNSVARQVQKMILADDEPALRRMLREVYPSLVTMDLIDTALDDDNGVSAFSVPPGCKGGAIAPDVGQQLPDAAP